MESENDNVPEFVHSRMNMDQWIAIFFVLLMVGSAIAMGAAVL